MFDVHDAPPWDGWLCYVEEDPAALPQKPSYWDAYLLSWVPAPLLVAAGAGIRANPVECLAWADVERPPFVRGLAEAGLL